MTDAFTTTDEALIEQIARATCGSPSDYEWRTWGEDDPGLRVLTLQYAARLLPTVRKAQADAWQAGVNFALPRAETTHFARHNPHRTEEDA
ncbi:hypothetical protein ACTXKN_12525 [Brachybacterium alimentarium]|uniref:hypothetical protein n=1 Tax=Brachybacterium alimentarium TaxID=47845 RepID=UPI003FD2E423